MKRLTTIILSSVSAFLMGFTAFALLPAIQTERVETDRLPYTYTQLHGRQVYLKEGCVYCHTQQVRAPFYGSDVDRGWGARGSTPADYAYDAPPLTGRRRLGPDLHDVGHRIADRNSVLAHLYNPRAVVPGSRMPSYGYLFEVKPEAIVLPSEIIVTVDSSVAPGDGYVLVAGEEALALSDYLMGLKLE